MGRESEGHEPFLPFFARGIMSDLAKALAFKGSKIIGGGGGGVLSLKSFLWCVLHMNVIYIFEETEDDMFCVILSVRGSHTL